MLQFLLKESPTSVGHFCNDNSKKCGAEMMLKITGMMSIEATMICQEICMGVSGLYKQAFCEILNTTACSKCCTVYPLYKSCIRLLVSKKEME